MKYKIGDSVKIKDNESVIIIYISNNRYLVQYTNLLPVWVENKEVYV